MSPEKQRIAIAEACGWAFLRYAHDSKSGESWPVWEKNGNTASIKTGLLPDYLSDLNAMHEAEKTLNEGQRRQMGEELMHVLNEQNRHLPRWLGPTAFDYFHTTSFQRAEAFLRAIGKWEESA